MIPLSLLPQSVGRLQQLAATRPLVVVCHHGVRSFHVAHFLHQQGHDAIWNITGGIDAWATQDPTIARY